MSRIEIRVVNPRSPRPPKGPTRRFVGGVRARIRALLLRPRLLVIGGIAGFVLIAGTPHAGWDYQCNHQMRGPGSCHSVARCAYHGIQGRRLEVPAAGQSCRLVTVLPLDWGKLIGG